MVFCIYDMKQVFFLCFNLDEIKILRKAKMHMEVEQRASSNYFGVYGVQTAQLQHYKRQEESSGQDGNQQILQILQKAYFA